MVDKKNVYLCGTGILIIAFALLRLAVSAHAPLVSDEAYYWLWGQHLDWGYHDNSPMIGWTSRLSTDLFGNNEIAVRLPTICAFCFAAVYVTVMALRWFDARTAFFSVLLMHLVPGFAVGGVIATTDGLQALAWVGASYHLARAYEENHWPHWISAGVWFGLGLLSKLSMLLFLPGALLYALLSPIHRRRLLSLRPYVGLAIGLALFGPVVYWNFQHHGNLARHVAYLGGANESSGIHLGYFGEFLAGQALLVSPLIFLAVVLAWWVVLRSYQSAGWIVQLLVWVSLPMVFIFALMSLHSRVYANWSGAAYIPAIVLLTALMIGNTEFLSSKTKKLAIQLWWGGAAVAFLMTGAIFVQLVTPVFDFNGRPDRITREVTDWPSLGRQVGEAVASMKNLQSTFVFGLRYQIASELAFYTPGKPTVVAINKWNRPNAFDYWKEDKDLIGQDAVGITRQDSDHLTRLKQVFEKVEAPVEIQLFRKGILSGKVDQSTRQVLYLYRAYGFRGGLRWDPKSTGDIRDIR